MNEDKERVEVGVYKMSTDNNGAPCIMDDTLSFGICMRPLRNSAKEGDIIIAFSDPDIKASPFRLLYVWVVERKLRPNQYYGTPLSAGRDDDIYEMVNGQFERKPLARHHNWYYHGKGAVPHPIYKNTLYRPNYRGVADPLPDKIEASTKGDGVNSGKANILLSTNYKQFPAGLCIDPNKFPLITALVPEIRQMHRWDHSPERRAELLVLARMHLPQPGAVPNE